MICFRFSFSTLSYRAHLSQSSGAEVGMRGIRKKKEEEQERSASQAKMSRKDVVREPRLKSATDVSLCDTASVIRFL